MVTRRRKLKKVRQYTGQEKREKRTNSDLQNITQKTKTRTPLKIGVNSGVSSSCSTCCHLSIQSFFLIFFIKDNVTLKVRLVDGRTPFEGRLEIYHLGQWRTVCNELFSRTATRVVCRMLGFST